MRPAATPSNRELVLNASPAVRISVVDDLGSRFQPTVLGRLASDRQLPLRTTPPRQQRGPVQQVAAQPRARGSSWLATLAASHLESPRQCQAAQHAGQHFAFGVLTQDGDAQPAQVLTTGEIGRFVVYRTPHAVQVGTDVPALHRMAGDSALSAVKSHARCGAENHLSRARRVAIQFKVTELHEHGRLAGLHRPLRGQIRVRSRTCNHRPAQLPGDKRTRVEQWHVVDLVRRRGSIVLR